MSFDDFDLRLGDVMRGERATMGKSLLDVQRELRIKASYIAAIENCDPSAFDTPGFIAGYVRSYARYLNMDPDRAFAQFCAESGFTTAHGMSAEASSIKKDDAPRAPATVRDPFAQPATPFAPAREAFFSRIEPGAIGSMLVLVVLIGSIGFGGWTVLNKVQQVQVVPVENTPDVLSDLDPLQAASAVTRAAEDDGFSPAPEALDRLYRPQALDVPVLVARDAPISTLDPDSVGVFAAPATPELPQVDRRDAIAQAVAEARGSVMQASAAQQQGGETPLPRVVEELGPGVTLVAARAAWVRVRAADGSTVYEGIMEPGETYAVAQTEEPHTIRVGESGAVYFAVDGQTYGPAGPKGSVTSNLALSPENLTRTYELADIEADGDLARVVAELQDVPGATVQPD
ncbi:helix-turn-helix domain-containing protein [Lutimaribacter sp. EGI FJ00015]|uniref:Helix-turn-helix domain-containing protein n=2 Tax=Lutimaribacter degradans TaxID=2945989 RepID=A0ACC5ZSK1_9RHOB|nr:helix-turn-helix domain-containing protein [Lutimaribacter sp. EGI FJ00013]MCM2561163.1 helix-turn-helix domain-containing protein [Lutimaribacter sp. EGI FJ00013]MCO0611888.1 helix-turn-helix domain-containing protein [Lutimaribacter sp. EGI FJ00015]MCO0634991.1 helix-turn-helix domain-containing protein [Lutimaribacter sp. EGI FJ00014]